MKSFGFIDQLQIKSEGVVLKLTLVFEGFFEGIEHIWSLKWTDLGDLSVETLTWKID